MIFNYIQWILQIIQGYLSWAFDGIFGRISAESQRRYAICSKCEKKSGSICSVCGCILKAKVRVKFPIGADGLTIGGCPENKW